MWPVGFLEVRPHGCGRQVECEGPRYNEHGRGADVLEGKVAYELCFDDGADIREVCTKVVHAGDGCARGDGRLDLG